MFSILFYRAAGLVLQKKTGVPAAFGTKNTFGKKKMNLKRVAKVSRGALAAVQGGFQLEFASISRVINHKTCYKLSAIIG